MKGCSVGIYAPVISNVVYDFCFIPWSSYLIKSPPCGSPDPLECSLAFYCPLG